MPTFRVYFNTHEYGDGSGTPRSASRLIQAVDADAARLAVRDLEKIGRRTIGMIHDARLCERVAGKWVEVAPCQP